MSYEENNDSDAPEEFTQEQAVREDEEIRRVEQEHKDRVKREGKERRRQWTQRKTPRLPKITKKIEDMEEPEETPDESLANKGMLPKGIVELLTEREIQVFSSDSEEDEKAEIKRPPKKKKPKSSGVDIVIGKEIPPPACLQSSLEFIKRRKMQVPRSAAVLVNSNQALRLATGMATKK